MKHALRRANAAIFYPMIEKRSCLGRFCSGLIAVRGVVISLLLQYCASTQAATPTRSVIERNLDRSVEVYGHYAPVRLAITKGVKLWNPTAIRVSPRGEIFVANYTGEICRVIDTDEDGLEDTAVLYCNVSLDGLRYPMSMAFRGNELYVATAQEIHVYEDIDGDGVADRNRTFLKIPSNDEHQYWTFGLCVGPDGYFYLNLPTDSYMANPLPDPNGWRGSLLRVSPDGRQVERMATGLRFCPGLAFDERGQLFLSDNEGGGNPTEELNLVVAGRFYGHNPAKFPGHPPVTPPLAPLISGRGTSGIAFNPSTNDFGGTAGDLFIAFWGSAEPYRDGSIGRVKLHREPDGTVRAREIPFCNWLSKVYDLTFGPSGDLYVTQFGETAAERRRPRPEPIGAIYRIFPAGWYTPAHDLPPRFPLIRGDVNRGRQIFADRGCVQCHALDGITEMLGPNLAGLGDQRSMDYEAVLKAIRTPSQDIRVGYEAEIFTLVDGESITGRVITSDASSLTLMVGSNRNQNILRSSIKDQQPLKSSLMPEGLLNGLNERDQRDLVAFLGIQERPFSLRIRYQLLVLAAVAVSLIVTSWLLRKATPSLAVAAGYTSCSLAGALIGQQFYMPLPPAIIGGLVIPDWRYGGAIAGALVGALIIVILSRAVSTVRAPGLTLAVLFATITGLLFELCGLNLIFGGAALGALGISWLLGSRSNQALVPPRGQATHCDSA